MDRKLVEDRCNELLRDFFKMNSIADNMAYSLDTELKCREAAQIFHQKYAHVFPSDIFADLLSDKMSELGLRPRRLGFDGDFEGYENIVLLFSDNYEQIKAENETRLLIGELNRQMHKSVFKTAGDHLREKGNDITRSK